MFNWLLIAMVYSGGQRRIYFEQFDTRQLAEQAGEAVIELVNKGKEKILDHVGIECFAHYRVVRRIA